MILHAVRKIAKETLLAGYDTDKCFVNYHKCISPAIGILFSTVDGDLFYISLLAEVKAGT